MNKTIKLSFLIFIISNIGCSPITYSNHVAPKQSMNKWALFQGKKKLTMFKYDTIQSNFNDYFIGKINTKWGVINSTGKEVIPFIHDEIRDLLMGRLIIGKDEKYGLIDTFGHVFCETKYQEIDNVEKDSTVLVKEKGEWKYVKNNSFIHKDTIVFKRPDRIAIFGNCNYLEGDMMILKCSENKLLNALFKNLNYPADAIKNRVSGMVVVSFWVSPSGKIENKKILRDIGYGCGDEGLRVLNKLTEWSPALKENRKVWSEFVLPIRFKYE